MAKITKQFFDLIDPNTNKKSSGLVVQLELKAETRKFINFHSFLNRFSNRNDIFAKNMERKQTINMKIADEQAKKIINSYLQSNEFKEI